mmetsp:Transcript_10499/g.32098  ORF Transcript_10499/g.32098 Transcript_10499/m.32098 type:complete len:329 (-) Transcript_10499:91-1077(-)
MLDAFPLTYSPAPALSATTSTTASEPLPDSTSRITTALYSASPPFSSSILHLGRSKSSGSTLVRLSWPLRISMASAIPTVLSSSMPSVCTTSACSMPRRCSVEAITSITSGEYTPMTARRDPAGFNSGPIKLKTVRIFIARLTGCTLLMAGWCVGANMNPIPARSMQRATPAGDRLRGIPTASNTSADPDLLEMDRLPCFATFAPEAAAAIAAIVEMFTVSAPSPPVPTISSTSGSVFTGIIRDRIDFAMAVTSSAVSFLARSSARNTASSSDVASPSSTAVIAASVSSADRFSRFTSFSRYGRIARAACAVAGRRADVRHPASLTPA